LNLGWASRDSGEPGANLSRARRERIARQQVEHCRRQRDEQITEQRQAQPERAVGEKDGVGEKDRQGEKRDSQQRVADASGVPVALHHPLIRALFGFFDRDLEHRLREHVKNAAAERADQDAGQQRRVPEVQTGPDEVDDHAQIRELDRQPDVRPAGQPLEAVAEELNGVQDGRVDVRHRGARPFSLNALFRPPQRASPNRRARE
jgi:hypothetical protein